MKLRRFNVLIAVVGLVGAKLACGGFTSAPSTMFAGTVAPISVAATAITTSPPKTLATAGVPTLVTATANPTSLSAPTLDLAWAAATASPTSPPGLRIGSSQLSSIDGMKLLYVPAGNFLMGSSDADSLAQPDEKPQHTVYLDAFWIDQTVVSNAMYMRCVQAAGCKPHLDMAPVMGMYPYYNSPRFANYPMIDVTWDEATAYCTWAGRRLPTEAEWEKAARGTDGRIYPWGDQAPTNDLANYDNNIGYPMPVDSLPMGASPYGALDMAGNVWQWVNDLFYNKYYSCENSLSLYLNLCSPSANPRGPKNGGDRGIRGGAWNNAEVGGTNETVSEVSGVSGVRSALRLSEISEQYFGTVGFRCALGISQ